MSERLLAEPRELDFESPGRRDYWAVLEHNSIWGEWHIPVTVIVGPAARPGQGLAAFGSTHGNEYEGPVALKHLLKEIRTENVRGRLIIVPVLNVAAFRSGARESVDDDGVNLNRAFVPGAGEHPALSGITHRIAKFVRDCVWPHVHVVLDIHSGGLVANYPPVMLFHAVQDPEQGRVMLETARWFGTPFIAVFQDLTPGLMTSEAERMGKICLGSELGGAAFVSHIGVRHARQGVLAAAINHGQMKGKIDPIDHHAAGTQRLVEFVDRSCFVPAPWPGLYEPLVALGAPIRKGEAAALVHDFHRIDEDPWRVEAGLDGYVMAQSARGLVTAGQHVLVVGREVGPDRVVRR